MKIFELLNPDEPTPSAGMGGMGSPTAPMASPVAAAGTNPAAGGMAQPNAMGGGAMGGAQPAQEPPMQTAGMMDTMKNFWTTPQPIGSARGAAPMAPRPAPGAPPAQSSGMVSRPFGNTAPGNALDAINSGLKQGQ